MKDITYCEFIDRCPPNDKIAPFKNWLKVHLIRGQEADKQKKMDAFKKRFN